MRKERIWKLKEIILIDVGHVKEGIESIPFLFLFFFSHLDKYKKIVPFLVNIKGTKNIIMHVGK